MLAQNTTLVNDRFALTDGRAAVINRTYGLVEIREAPNGIEESLGRLVGSLALSDAIRLGEALPAEQRRGEDAEFAAGIADGTIPADFADALEIERYFAQREAEEETRHVAAGW